MLTGLLTKWQPNNDHRPVRDGWLAAQDQAQEQQEGPLFLANSFNKILGSFFHDSTKMASPNLRPRFSHCLVSRSTGRPPPLADPSDFLLAKKIPDAQIISLFATMDVISELSLLRAAAVAAGARPSPTMLHLLAAQLALRRLFRLRRPVFLPGSWESRLIPPTERKTNPTIHLLPKLRAELLLPARS